MYSIRGITEHITHATRSTCLWSYLTEQIWEMKTLKSCQLVVRYDVVWPRNTYVMQKTDAMDWKGRLLLIFVSHNVKVHFIC